MVQECLSSMIAMEMIAKPEASAPPLRREIGPSPPGPPAPIGEAIMSTARESMIPCLMPSSSDRRAAGTMTSPVSWNRLHPAIRPNAPTLVGR